MRAYIYTVAAHAAALLSGLALLALIDWLLRPALELAMQLSGGGR